MTVSFEDEYVQEVADRHADDFARATSIAALPAPTAPPTAAINRGLSTVNHHPRQNLHHVGERTAVRVAEFVAASEEDLAGGGAAQFGKA